MQVLPHKGFVYIENEKVEEDSSGIYVPVETVKGPISRGVIVSVHSSSTVMTVGRRVAFIADKAMRMGNGVILREEDVVATLQEG